MNGKITEPKNVDFKYNNGSFEIIKESNGNKINKNNHINKKSIIDNTHKLNSSYFEGL